MFLYLLLGILIGWVTLPVLIWVGTSLPWMIDNWLHPRPDPFWKPGKKR